MPNEKPWERSHNIQCRVVTYVQAITLRISLFNINTFLWYNTLVLHTTIDSILYKLFFIHFIRFGSYYRAHTEPLMLANRLLSLQDINLYVIGIFIYNYVTQTLPHIFENYFQQNKDVHEINTRQANDFHVTFSRLQVRKFSIKIHGSEVWNSFPTYIKISISVMDFKKKLC